LLFGQVIDASARKPVAGAIVTISGSTIPVAGPNAELYQLGAKRGPRPATVRGFIG